MKTTVGKQALDLLSKEPETLSPVEQMSENLTDYDKNIYEAVDRGRASFLGDFFLVVITKKEPLMENVIRNYFGIRQSCPTPDYDQTLYRYDKNKEHIEFLWVVPSKEACIYLKQHALEVHPSEKELLNFVLDFADGTLFERCKKFNNEPL